MKRKKNIEPLPTYKRFAPEFMVWVAGNYAPATRHTELGVAMAEAERLCRKENKPAYVMSDVWKCEPAENPVKWSYSINKL